MHVNYRRRPRKNHRFYTHIRKEWLKRHYHHSYRQRIREALRLDLDIWELPILEEVWDPWFYD